MLHRIGLEDCPYCGNSEVYRSKPEVWLDGLLSLFLFDLARCHGCMRQHYRFILFPAPEFSLVADPQVDAEEDFLRFENVTELDDKSADSRMNLPSRIDRTPILPSPSSIE